MIFFLLILIVLFVAVIRLWKRKDYELINFSLLAANFVYVLYFINYYYHATDSTITAALIFAYLIFYIFVIPVIALVFALIGAAFLKIKEKYA